jgi:pimeloyl-ACP methyl ester carboxylesterase
MSSDVFRDLKHLEVNGVSLAYREAGQGEPVVLVHGGASDIRTWGNQVTALSSNFRVIAYSRRYARPNEDIGDGLDDQMHPHVDDLLALLDVLGVSPAHFVGHSWGGFICLLAAIRKPQAVRRLVLMEPPAVSLFVSTPPRPSQLLKLLLRRPRTALAIIRFGSAVTAAQKAFRCGDDEAAMRAFATAVLGRDTFERLSEERLQQVRDNMKADRAQLLGAGFPPLTKDEVRSVRTPTLLLCSEHSPSLFRRLIDRLEELLPNVETVKVPNASHIMHEDNPVFVNEQILAFLSSDGH